MSDRMQASWIITVAGMALLASPGCSTKWLSSGTDSDSAESGGLSASSGSDRMGTKGGRGDGQSQRDNEALDLYAQGSGSSPAVGDRGVGQSQQEGDVPNLYARSSASEAADGGPLRGFERLAPGQVPSEERLSRGSIASRMLSSDVMDKRMAELRREEDAAIAAGFNDAFFGYDQSSIVDETRDHLSSNADWIKSHPSAQIKVSGHCDERGTQDYNLVLGDRRAKAVKRYLIDLGVKPQQLSTISFGKNRPFCAEHDESCHRQNRRGHFLLSEK